MITASTIAARHPESAQWIALYDLARAAVADPGWITSLPSGADTPPFITGATLAVDPRRAARLMNALLRRTDVSPDDALALIDAAITGSDTARERAATSLGIAADVAVLMGAMAAMPVLHACRTAWSARIPASWTSAVCPVCGAWAMLAEARGLERSLRHRCAGCGADWNALPVRCAFCGESDHTRLASLVADHAEERARVDGCMACGAYVKTITTLAACAPDEVPLLDLESVHLDVAAVQHGFHRPGPMRHEASIVAAPRRAGRIAALFGAR